MQDSPAAIQKLEERIRQLSAELERCRNEAAAAAASHERMKLMSDNAPVLLASLDAEHRYKFVNAAYCVRFNCTVDQIVGRTVASVLGQQLWEHIRPWREKVLTGEPVEYEVDVDRGTGSIDNVRCMLNPERDATGKVVGYVAAIIDVTRQKQAEDALRKSEEALRAADRRKDEFLAVLAHELRNPLSPLVNALELVRRSGTRDETLQRTMEMMERQLTQLVRLVDDLLDVSRITRGRFELRRAPVSVRLAIESALESCSALIAARTHHIKLDLAEETLLVDGDFARLSQVFSNLLSNSVKYTDPGGHITVKLEKQGEEAVITVSDTGIGIPSDALDSVFDMFSQIRAHRPRAEGGLGIGLALVRSLVQMHGGTVSAYSAGPGTGSTFTVRLPLMQSEPLSRRMGEPRGNERVRNRKRRILVADDNADAAASLALLLEMQGHETRTAADGRQAVELASTFQPDIIFMDVGMPQLDGLEATRQIRAQPWGKSMLIVALTGWGQAEDRNQTRQVGMDLHLVKPISLEGIAAVLAHS